MPDLPLDQLKAKHPTCKDCKWWIRNEPDTATTGGVCDHAWQASHVATKRHIVHASDGEAFASYGGRVSYLHTGPDFYCPHYEVKA